MRIDISADLPEPLPTFVAVTGAEHDDAIWPDDLPIEPGSFYGMVCDEVASRRLRRIARADAFFITNDVPAVRYSVAVPAR